MKNKYRRPPGCDAWLFKYKVYGPDLRLTQAQEELQEFSVQAVSKYFSTKGWSILETRHVEEIVDFMEGKCKRCIATVHHKF